MTRTVRVLSLFAALFIGLSGCSVGRVLDLRKSGVRVDETDLSRLGRELSEELLRQGVETIAVTDFTDEFGRVSEFERGITERIFLSMAGFSGKLWVVGGEYLEHALDSQESRDKVWPIMGIDAVVSGTIEIDDRKISLRIQVTEARTSRTLHAIRRECRVQGSRDDTIYLAQPDVRPRSVQQSFYGGIPAFTWPPPEASASIKIPSHFLSDTAKPETLAQVANRLESAFEQTGYAEHSYYSVPGGFALVSRLEQFNPDGSSKDLPERWAVEVAPPKVFSLSSYLKALFFAQEGHFRIISFVVTSAPFAQQPDSPIRREEAMKWLSDGVQALPDAIGDSAYTDAHYCVALVYEFEQISRNHEPNFKRLSLLPGLEHLQQAHLWEFLEK